MCSFCKKNDTQTHPTLQQKYILYVKLLMFRQLLVDYCMLTGIKNGMGRLTGVCDVDVDRSRLPTVDFDASFGEFLVPCDANFAILKKNLMILKQFWRFGD